MIFDYKKKYKDLYLPKETPMVIDVPKMNFIMVDGAGDPNDPEGEFNHAIEVLYGLSYTIKMSYKKDKDIPGFFQYVVPPLEGLWWMKDEDNMDFTQKDQFMWTCMIRQPEFVTREVFQWAMEEMAKKKPNLDLSKARLQEFQEGLFVQALHIGPYDDEGETVAKITDYIHGNGYQHDMGSKLPDGMVRHHHEIYLSDPRKAKPEKMKTVIRHPIKK